MYSAIATFVIAMIPQDALALIVALIAAATN